MLGYRVFCHHKLLRKSNLRKFQRKIKEKINLVQNNLLSYDSLFDSINGWLSYAMWANTYKLRKNFMNYIDELFCNRIVDKDIDRWLKVLI